MEPLGWLTLAVVLGTVVALARELAPHEIIMTAAVTVLTIAGVLRPEQAVAGFGSVAVATIASLLVVARGIKQTGVLEGMVDRLFKAGEGKVSLLRMMFAAGSLSAFMNNTPIVAMFAPALITWCKRRKLPPSRVLMPLAYSTTLGGICTLIGTATIIVVDGMMRQHGLDGIRMFEISALGLPAAAAGIIAIRVLAPRVLPDRQDPVEAIRGQEREFLVEMVVEDGGPLVGKSIEGAGLRHLEGFFLTTIVRGEEVLGPAKPADKLQAADRLVFAGVSSMIEELRSLRGLRSALEPKYHLEGAHTHTYEAVVSMRSPLIGLTIKDSSFRQTYKAAVLAVHRAGQRLDGKLGDVVIRPGDTLLLEATEEFGSRWGGSHDFSLVSWMGTKEGVPAARRPWALITTGVMIVLVTTELLPMVIAALAAACVMVLARVVTPRQARRAVNLPILVTIGCAIALGDAMQVSGAADVVGALFHQVAGAYGAVGLLALLFVVASLLNAAITNVATAAILFPIAVAAAEQAGLEPRAFALTTAIAASLSFITPIAYQTNLMVYGPGGYRFGDFARLGVPLLVVVGTTTISAATYFFL